MVGRPTSVEPTKAPGGLAPPEQQASPRPPAPLSRDGRRALHDRRRSHWWRWAAIAVLVVGSLFAVAGIELAQPIPTPTAHAVQLRSITVPGPAPRIPWPAKGQAAVAVEALGTVVSSRAELPVPIASLAKMMTAYLVLRDHPLPLGAQGPDLVMTAADEAEAGAEEAADDSSIPVESGEVLSERQLLDGLMVHSADNFADVLGDWDAGSVQAFVSKMNAAAASLEMRETHYADTSGLDPSTVSTPADQLRLAMRAMQIPTFASVVSQQTVTLPLAGTVSSFVPQVGTQGIVGIKSGFTQAAMGCLVLAAWRVVDGLPVEVLAAVTGQPGFDPLEAAAQVTIPLLDAAGASVRIVRVLHRGERAVVVSSAWSSSRIVGVVSESADVLALPGQTVSARIRTRRPRIGESKGSDLGSVTMSVGDEHVTSVLRSTATLKGPTLSWRLERF